MRAPVFYISAPFIVSWNAWAAPQVVPNQLLQLKPPEIAIGCTITMHYGVDLIVKALRQTPNDVNNQNALKVLLTYRAGLLSAVNPEEAKQARYTNIYSAFAQPGSSHFSEEMSFCGSVAERFVPYVNKSDVNEEYESLLRPQTNKR